MKINSIAKRINNINKEVIVKVTVILGLLLCTAMLIRSVGNYFKKILKKSESFKEGMEEIKEAFSVFFHKSIVTFATVITSKTGQDLDAIKAHNVDGYYVFKDIENRRESIDRNSKVKYSCIYEEVHHFLPYNDMPLVLDALFKEKGEVLTDPMSDVCLDCLFETVLKKDSGKFLGINESTEWKMLDYQDYKIVQVYEGGVNDLKQYIKESKEASMLRDDEIASAHEERFNKEAKTKEKEKTKKEDDFIIPMAVFKASGKIDKEKIKQTPHPYGDVKYIVIYPPDIPKISKFSKKKTE